MSTQHPTQDSDVRHTTIEALARQLHSDAEHLADLAQTLADKQTPTHIEDALDATELVAETARALRAATA